MSDYGEEARRCSLCDSMQHRESECPKAEREPDWWLGEEEK